MVGVTLANTSDAPLAFIILPNDCSFSLEASQTAKKEWVLANTPCQSEQPAEDDVVVLQPGEEKLFEFDFHDERWLVQAENSEPIKIGALD